MLGDKPVMAVVPTHDLDKARPFYEEQLGLRVDEETSLGSVLLAAGDGTTVLLYETQVAIPAEHTVATFLVDDVAATVEELEARGVTFQEYDLQEFGYEDAPEGTTKVVEIPDAGASAWFTDPEGNILAVFSRA
ncbi:MAG: VOC family protein [Nitriliruptorales bacterium]|nr:VOC family protein [Nitriliruptorales bacterium]